MSKQMLTRFSIKRRLSKLLVRALPAFLLGFSLQAAEIANHFDSPEQIKAFNPKLKDPAAKFTSDTMAAGAGSYKAIKGFYKSFGSEPLTRGVLTFWIYDDYFEMIDNWEWHHVNYGLKRTVDGKQKTFKCEIRRYQEGWRADLNDPSQEFRYFPVPEGPNHGGWTRFDLVIPEGPGPKNMTVYIDGYKAFTTPGTYDSVSTLSTDWIPYVDELSYDADPASFRPNPITQIAPDSPCGLMTVEPGKTLPLELILDPKGARAVSGDLSVALLDGRGQTLVSTDTVINWSKVKRKPFKLTLSTPPRSGYFWLEARYQEAGKPVDISRRKINLQFLSPGFADESQAPLDLFRNVWDFIPLGKNLTNIGGIRSASPTPEELAIPAEAPSDWSQAHSLLGPWLFTRGYFNPRFSCHAGWYHQTVEVPSSWKKHDIMLDVDSPESIATVFANGKLAGTVEWPGGILNLSAFAKPGKTLDLAIHVSADPVSGYYRLARKYLSPDFQVPRNLKIRGLAGDVVLFPQTKGARLDGVAIRTSVAKHTLTAIFEVSGLTAGKTYRIKAAATQAGETALALPETSFEATANTAKVTVSAAWDNPVLWELNAPYLYELNSTLLDSRGRSLANLWPERFGFREITNNGPDLTLNGRPITLFHCGGPMVNAPESAQWCEKFGFLSRYDGSGREDARLLDEAGKTRTGERLHPEAYQMAPLDAAKTPGEVDPKFWEGIADLLAYQIKDTRNHPGVFFHRGTLGGGRNGNGGMYNPYFQNGTWVNKRTGNEVSMRALTYARRVIDIIHQLDPTRLVTAQDSGSVNDTMHITEYAGFQPIQEFVERTEYWRAFGTKPFLISEQAAPMFPNWTDACSQGKGWRGVPCYAEWSAITRGDVAYARTELDEKTLANLEKDIARKRQRVRDTVKNPLKQDAEIVKIRMTMNQWAYSEKDEAMPNVIWKERMRAELFHWRANNLGLIGYWFSNLGPRLEDCYPEFNAPVTGFLAGTQAKPTLKTHIFAPGETLQRDAILLNNSHKPEKLTCEWAVELDGTIIARESKTETIPAGGKVFVPITAKIPAGQDRTGTITVTFVKDGVTLRSERCEIDVIAPKPFANRGRIALVDPEGDTAKALKDAGVEFQVLCFDEDFSAFDTIIFGRKAFNYEFNLLPEGLELGALTLQGKRILIMEQDEKTLRERFKLRTEYLSPRDVFGRIGNHPILGGLPDRLLSYWRGTATLTDGYAVAHEKGKVQSGGFGNGGTWKYLWNDEALHNRPMKWGNTHNVATITVIKPDTGNFRTLVDCGYGNNFAAAWELENGKSRIVFNQLDVSGRSEAEPAAVRYLQNLVGYVQTMPAVSLRKAAYWGGPNGAALLKSLDVPFKAIAAPSEATPGNDILVLGDMASAQLKAKKAAIAEFAAAGGTVFSLPRSVADFAVGWTPFVVTAKKRTVNHSLVGKPTAPLLAGLGNSDFYWKGNMEVVSIAEAKGASLLPDTGILAEIPHGKGRYILCQVEPALFGDITLDHWLKPSKYNTERMLRTLISNAGAALSEPRLLDLPKAPEQLDRIITLAGDWQVQSADIDATDCPDKQDANWRDIVLPGAPQKAYPDWQGVKGAFWFRRTLTLDKALPSNETCRVVIGRVSGSDILFVNGEKTATTNSETNVNSVSTISRDYKLPASLFRQGENELVLFVTYDTNAALGMKGSTGEIAAPLDLKLYKTKIEGKIPEAIDLASRSEWWGQKAKDASTPWNHRIRQRLAVPALVQPQRSEWSDLTGYFWYWRQFKLKEPLPEGVQPVLMLGAVDDEDTTYFNEVKIGHTGKDTNPDNYWMAPRAYPIPPELFKVGNNVIKVQMNDFNVGGGISKGPVQIVFEDPEATRQRKLAERPYLHTVDRQDDPYWHHGF
jgi:hypothetical protein